MSIKLLAVDLDGTIMTHDLTITPRVRRALYAAQARGIAVTIATGRMVQTSGQFAWELGIRAPIICYQGAVVADPSTGAMLYHQPMPLEPAREAIALLQPRGYQLNVYINDRAYTTALTPIIAQFYATIHRGIVPTAVGDLLAFVTQPPTKIVVVGEDEQLSLQLIPELTAYFHGRLNVTRSHPLFTELTHPAVSKASGLAWLARHLGVMREEVMAIGDNLNDADMIAWAGIGVAVGNAVAEAKAVATYVAPPISEDGAAEAIERFILTDNL